MDEPLEVYLLPGTSAQCIICRPTPESLVAGLHGGGFTLCPAHLLRLAVVGMAEAGEPLLRAIERADA